jgi:hypothetical protein
VYKSENRFGRRGVRKDYMSAEEKIAGATYKANQLAEKLKKIQAPSVTDTPHQTEMKLLQLCNNDEEEKFILDVCNLLKKNVFSDKEVHFQVLKNIVEKLRFGRRHHYSDLIISISRLYKNQLGTTGHRVLAVSFLPFFYTIFIAISLLQWCLYVILFYRT